MRPILFLLTWAALGPCAPAWAEGLTGRPLTFHIETYDDPAVPLYESRVHDAVVGEGPELGLIEEGRYAGFDLIPVIVDVSAARVTLDYSTAEPGELYKARFNGYVLDFGPGCPRIARARLDPDATTLPIDNKRLRVSDGVLRIDVSGMRYDRDSRVAVDLELADC